MANLEGITVTAYIKQYSGEDTQWAFAGSDVTGEDGSFSISGLTAGTYRLKFNDPNGSYLTEYYNNKNTLDEAGDIAVDAAETVTGKNAQLGASAYIQGTVTD